jgi:hypothetical protein
MRRIVSLMLGSALALASAGIAVAGGPPQPAFYVDGTLYRTIGTPTDFSGTGAPDHSYDHIYALGSGLRNVAEAAPGDRDYNGGRWQVYTITWISAPVQLTSAEQVHAYAEAEMLIISSSPAAQFECPVIPMGGRRA